MTQRKPSPRDVLWIWSSTLLGLVLAVGPGAAGAEPGPTPAPRDGVAAVELARAEWLGGRFDAAARRLDELETSIAGSAGPSVDRARLALARAELAYYRAWIVAPVSDATLVDLRSARVTVEAAGDAALAAEARDLLALALFGRHFRASDHAEARALLDSALATRRRLGDRRGVAESLFHLGLTYEHPKDPTPADTARAGELYRESLAVATAGGFDYEASYPVRHLAGQADDAGDLAAAIAGFERSLELRRRAGATIVVPPALTALADALIEAGDLRRARALYEEAIRLAREIGAPRFAEEATAALAKLDTPTAR
jgi:tetratricopeptide (TPR) repeat protein